MKVLFSTVFVIAGLLLASCGKESGTIDSDLSGVRFNPSINQSVTKAANDAWAENDAIGVFMVEQGTTTIAEGAANKKYVTLSGNGFTPELGSEIYYPVNGSEVDFVAYYPYQSSITGLGLYGVNVANQSSQPNIDLLWSNDAKGHVKTDSEVALTFDHMLSKLIILTQAGEGLVASDLANMTVTIEGMNQKAEFNLATGALGAYSSPSTIGIRTVNMGEEYEAIVLPATFETAGSLTMKFALNNAKGEVFTWVSPANEIFEAGKKYEYTMTLTRLGVNFTSTVNDWTEVPRTGVAD